MQSSRATISHNLGGTRAGRRSRRKQLMGRGKCAREYRPPLFRGDDATRIGASCRNCSSPAITREPHTCAAVFLSVVLSFLVLFDLAGTRSQLSFVAYYPAALRLSPFFMLHCFLFNPLDRLDEHSFLCLVQNVITR